MLTLVAAVLTYDCALENCERWSSRSEFRYATSETRAEKDIVAGLKGVGRYGNGDSSVREGDFGVSDVLLLKCLSRNCWVRWRREICGPRASKTFRPMLN
jgi:hypothetical protein